MNRPRWHKVLADLWGNRIRSLLVVASITVGLFALGVIATLYAVMSEDMRVGYASMNPANIQVIASPFDQDLVDHIQRMEGVREAEGVRTFALRLEASPGEWITIDLRAVPDYAEMQINQVDPVQGVWPPGDREIVIEQYKLPDTNAQVGDFVTLELPSGKTRQLKLIGVVQDQTIGAFATGPGFFLSPVQGFVTQDTLEWLGQSQPDSFNTLNVTIARDSGDEEAIKNIADRVRKEVEINGSLVASTAIRSSFEHPNRTFVDAIVWVLFLLGLLVVFLSGFLITNTLQALLNQQVEQIGIMKTVGARRAQIAGVYMMLILIYGILAAVAAVPLAYIVSFQLADFLAQEINFSLLGYRIVPAVVILQAGLALIVPQVAAFIPIWQGTRLSVQEALSGLSLSGLSKSNPPSGGWFSRRITRLRRVSRPMLISLRNTFRRKIRLALTLTTLTLGGAIFIATFNVQVSMGKYVENISQYFLADVNLALDRPYRISEIQQQLSNVPGVGRVEGWATAQSELVLEDGSAGERVQLLAPPVNSPLVNPILLEGRWITTGDQNAIAVNELFLSRYPEMEVGDTLRLRVNGKETEWIVVGFFQLAGKSGGFLAYTSYDYLSELIHQPNKAALYRIVADRPGLNQDQQAQLGKDIEAHLQEKNIRIAEITDGLSLSRIAGDGFSTLTAFLLFMAVLTALVGSIGLTGTMSMNVMERTREIGVMRAIGASDRILMKMVLVEGLIIGIISWLLGSLLAFPISKAMSDGISQSLFDAPSNFAITATGFLIWLGAVLFLSVLASVMPARNAARLTIREVLAYE